MTKADEIVLESEEDATAVLTVMHRLLNSYEEVTFGDFLNLVGIESNYLDEKTGWTDLTGAEVKKVDKGFVLSLPTEKKL